MTDDGRDRKADNPRSRNGASGSEDRRHRQPTRAPGTAPSRDHATAPDRSPATARPPALLSRLVRGVVAHPAREAILGDLAEGFARRVSRQGRGPARRWYRRQAVQFLFRVPMSRMRGDGGGRGPARRSAILGGLLGGLLSDLRHGLRVVRGSPLLSAAAVLTIGVAAGFTTVVFSLVWNALAPGVLPLPDGDRIVVVTSTGRAVSQEDVEAFRRLTDTFEGLETFRQESMNLALGDAPPERHAGALVSAGALDLAGVPPLLGRTFREGEDRPGSARRVVLGHRLWTERFGADPEVVGRSVRIDRGWTTVVGVMPPGFRFPVAEELWVTPVARATGREEGPGAGADAEIPAGAAADRPGIPVGKLWPGVSREAASAAVAAVARRRAGELPASDEEFRARVTDFKEIASPGMVTTLLGLVAAAAAFVIAIACANTANLLLARSLPRHGELSLRAALGAGRWRMLRLLLAETAVVGLLGVVVAIATAAMVPRFLTVLDGPGRPFWLTSRLDGSALVFALALTVGAALLAGILPALRVSGARAGAALRSHGPAAAAPGRLAGALVVVELVLACGLLVGGGLVVRSLLQLGDVDPGFAVDDVLTARLSIAEDDLPTAAAWRRFVDSVVGRLEAEPGVVAATVSQGVPAVETWLWNGSVDEPEGAPVTAGRFGIGPGFVETFDLPVLQGRNLEAADLRVEAPGVALVNETFVRRHLGGGPGLGRRLIARGDGPDRESWIVVGVVPDSATGAGPFGSNRIPEARVYLPLKLRTHSDWLFLTVRAAGPSAGLARSAREAVAAVVPDAALYEVRTLAQAIDDTHAVHRAIASLFSLFGLATLLFTAVGVFGIMSSSVSRRTREMGVRMALGAEAGSIVCLVYRRVLVQLVLGLVPGLALGAALARPLSAALYGVESGDPVVYAIIAGILGLAAVVAALLPALRATRVDPVEALRTS